MRTVNASAELFIGMSMFAINAWVKFFSHITHFNHLDGAIQLDKSQRLVHAERCPKTAASRCTTSCIFAFPGPFSLCTRSLMSLLPGKVDAKLVFGKKPRSWVQDFINKPLRAIYGRTTFRTRGRLGRFATRGP